ncbi:MAG: HAD family hydrolase [Hyphomicrobiales bacterium]
MDVKLVALDIDGTIIPPNTPPERAYPSPRLKAAVRALRERGVVVVVASGRMFPGTAEIARHLGLDTPVICQQGCSIHLLDGTMLHEFAIDGRAARELVEYAREIDRVYEWFNPLRYIVSRRCPEAEEYGRVSGIVPEYRPDPERSGVRPTGVGIISTHEEASGIHRHLAGLHGEALHVLDFPSVTVAVAPEANKGHALSLLCAGLDIDRSRVLAVGDSVNDAPMLAWAGRGVALAHSDRYARDAADEVLAENGDTDPVATLLEGLLRAR